MAHVAILGAGLAGLAAAQRCRQLQARADVYEKNHYLGGHANSQVFDGFTFDEGPHVSFTKNQTIKDLFATALGGNFREFSSMVSNYWKGHWVRHPAQVNLFGLPVDIVERCLVDFVENQLAPQREIHNYEDWLYASFGKTFSEEFPFRYTRKYWTVEPRDMSTDWVGPRLYKANLQEVIRGALAPNPENVHYITHFRYPTEGGFGAYIQAVDEGEPVQTGFEVTEIDLARRELRFTNGKSAHYEQLISSLPLPELVRRIINVPREVATAAQQLICTSLCLVDVGIERNVDFPPAHWLYFYDEDICFARVSFPHVFAPSNAPPGCGSIQVEVYHTRFKSLPSQDMISRVIEDLQKTGLLKKDDKILVTKERRIPYANVLFDHQRKTNLEIVNNFLAKHGVACCGRYGLWGYHWTDESIVSGWEAAEKVLK